MRDKDKSPTAVSVLNNPALMKIVRKKQDKEPKPETMKAQFKILREIYRILRDSPYIYHSDTFPVLPDVIQELESLFPSVDPALIKFAAFVEDNTSLLPMNPFLLWGEVPTRDVINIFANSLLENPDRLRAYTLVGTYLWMALNRYKRDNNKMFTLELNQMEYLYDSFGVKKSKTIREKWKSEGISLSQDQTSNHGSIRTKSTIAVPHNSIIWQYLNSDVSVDRVSYNKNTKLELDIPPFDDLLARLRGYAFLYPRDDFGSVNPIAPIFYQTDSMIRVPLTKHIVPAIVGALFTPEELGWLLRGEGPTKRNSKVRTILGNASGAINSIDKQLTQFNRIAIHLNARHRGNRHDALKVFNTMSHNGVRVDIAKLENIDLDALDPQKHNINALTKERKKVKDFIERSFNHRLYGKYQFHVYTERVYTRNYAIQNLPNVFKEAIIPDEGYYFLYFDIVANDISMLFNLSGDKKGLSILKSGGDPYLEIAKQVLPDNPDRDLVKAFINPWLYGAGAATIVKKSAGKLSRSQVDTLKQCVPIIFPKAGKWLEQIKQDVKANESIPAALNPIEGVEVPMPALFAGTVAASFTMQRYGASLFRLLLVKAAEYGYEPVVFVHDSLLLRVPETRSPVKVIERVRDMLSAAIDAKGICALVVKIGTGNNWFEAEKFGEKYLIGGK